MNNQLPQVINLCSHPIRILNRYTQNYDEFQPSGFLARAAQIFTHSRMSPHGYNICTESYGPVVGVEQLQPEPGSILLASRQVKEQLKLMYPECTVCSPVRLVEKKEDGVSVVYGALNLLE